MENNKIYNGIYDEVFDSFLYEYNNGERSLCPYNDNDESLEGAVEAYFEKIGFSDYVVTSEEVFDSPSCTIGYISVAWTDEDGLHMISESWIIC